MIVSQTRSQRMHAELTKLINVLDPIATKYKRLSMAKDAMKGIGWSVYSGDSYGGGTACTMYLSFADGSSWFNVYEYGKKCATLTDLVAMLKGQLQRYELSTPTIYMSSLNKFIDSAVGEGVETTEGHFKVRKELTVAALKRAIDYVNGLEDCKNPKHSQFDERD